MVFQKKNREAAVIDGVRSTTDVPARLGQFGPDGVAPKILAAETPAYDPARSLYRFRSRAVNHMILLWAEPDEYMPGGRIKRGKIVHAKFKDGQYETTNAEYAKTMLANPNCGIGRDFWDADHEDQLARDAQYKAFKRNVKADPELFARFRQDVAAGDFDDVTEDTRDVPEA